MTLKNIHKYILLVILIIISYNLQAQNLDKTKERVKKLSSSSFHGRGYVKNGSEIAAQYIANELNKLNLKCFNNSCFQNFEYNINSFPGKIDVKFDNKHFIAGTDYMIGASSPSFDASIELYKPDSILLNDTIKFISHLLNSNNKNKALVIDYAQTENINIKKFYIKLMLSNIWFAGIVELIPDNLIWSVSTIIRSYPIIKLKRELYNSNFKNVKIQIKAKFINKFKAKNIIFYVPGEKEEFVVLCAHYDHLGRMGKKVLIPGAQDNASGTALVMDFADYYSKNKPKYSIAFMLFFGEEAGLLGSSYYVDNPLFDLKKIKLVINFDMVGTGDDGIAIVNGATKNYEQIWETFNKVNEENKYISSIKQRGESINSDHYPFHKNNIKAIFIYSMGGKTFYHSPKDKFETLNFKGYNGLFNLVTKVIETI